MIAIGVAKSSGLIARVAQKPCTSPRVPVPTHASAYLHIRVLLTRVANKERNGGEKEEREREEREEEKETFIVSASRNFRGCKRTHEGDP